MSDAIANKALRRREAARAARIRRFLEEEGIDALFDAMHDQLLHAFEESTAEQQDTRERLWVWLKWLRQFRSELTQIMETGKLAEIELEQVAADRTPFH